MQLGFTWEKKTLEYWAVTGFVWWGMLSTTWYLLHAVIVQHHGFRCPFDPREAQFVGHGQFQHQL